MAISAALRTELKNAITPILGSNRKSKLLLLSCVDYRYPGPILEFMADEGYEGRYYHLSMAGASHAAKHNEHWKSAFNDHLKFAVCEGKVDGVLILDHLDCRAFQLYEGVPDGDLIAERKKHIEVATDVVARIVHDYPKLAGKVTALLLPVVDQTEEIAAG